MRTVNTCFVIGYLALQFSAERLPLVSVGEDAPVDSLVNGVLPRLVQVGVFQLEAYLLDLDHEHLFVVGLYDVIGVAGIYHLLGGDVLELVPAQVFAQHV